MCVLKYFTLLLQFFYSFIISVSSEKAGFLSINKEPTQILLPCRSDDMEGLEKSMYLFSEKTSTGIPEYNMTATDPYIIPALEILSGGGVALRFTDIHVEIPFWQYINFKMSKHTYEEAIRAYPDINADLHIKLTESGKIFDGKIRASSNSTITLQFYHVMTRDLHGKRHMDIGEEVITVETKSKPLIMLNPEFTKELFKDPDARKLYGNYPIEAAVSEFINQAVKQLFITTMENLKIVTKLLPVSAIFSDL